MKFETGKYLKSKKTGSLARIEHMEVYLNEFNDDEVTVELTLEFNNVVKCINVTHSNRHDYEVVDDPGLDK